MRLELTAWLVLTAADRMAAARRTVVMVNGTPPMAVRRDAAVAASTATELAARPSAVMLRSLRA
jgi:hypothetical protein